LQAGKSGAATQSAHAARAVVLATPGLIGPYIDLFRAASDLPVECPVYRRYTISAAAWMLALDGDAMAVLVKRHAELRASLKIDLAEHLRPVLDAVLDEQRRRGDDTFETPIQFLLRRDDPTGALDVAERFFGRARRRMGDAAWREDRRPPWRWAPGRRLRVGYVCADLTLHPVGLSMRTVLLHHDKKRFEIFVYDLTSRSDKTVAGPIAMGADSWRQCRGLSPEAMATAIRRDEIDILVDLSGAALGTGDTVFSRPAAPARVAMIGYPGAMGRQTIDYTVVDRSAVPESERDGFSERLIVMPESFLPLDDTFTLGDELPSRPDVGLPPDAFVMAAFNRLDKVNLVVFV
jgi:predicted O-linked N-acetylglucosamine transferase (SPINDLY family)